MKLKTTLAALCTFAATGVFAQIPPFAATDGLGRELPLQQEVGSPREGRHVAMFYFLWTGDPGSRISERQWDLDVLWHKHPEVFEDFDNPHWGGGAGVAGKYYYWGQPVYGYYSCVDYWVHLKNVQLLTDAGVDLLVIDATNNAHYPVQADALMRAMQTVNRQGLKAPKIVFYTNTSSGETMQKIYDDIYREGAPYRYPECWFLLDGKPLILGNSAEAKGKNYADFFTIREAQWPTEPDKTDGWPWISFTRPQHVYSNHRGEREIVNVSVSQHPNPGAGMGGAAFYGNMDNWGRSYRNGTHGNPEQDIRFGYNFQEQWDYALKQDVPFVFVTGWNEWIAGKWASHDDNPKHSWFCDQASPEYSRDIEPSLTAGLDDHYYMQLAANVRRYKGVAEVPAAPAPQTIRRMADWEQIPARYTDYRGDVVRRDAPGAQSEPKTVYTNHTGRNDFLQMKAVRDKKKLYLYARTAEDITTPRDENWMTVYLDTDADGHTGWCGYDYKVTAGTQLMRHTSAGWQPTGKVACTVEGAEMYLSIPLRKIGLRPETVSFRFKWADNMQKEDPMDWYVNGDAAPGSRFSYVYRE